MLRDGEMNAAFVETHGGAEAFVFVIGWASAAVVAVGVALGRHGAGDQSVGCGAWRALASPVLYGVLRARKRLLPLVSSRFVSYGGYPVCGFRLSVGKSTLSIMP